MKYEHKLALKMCNYPNLICSKLKLQIESYEIKAIFAKITFEVCLKTKKNQFFSDFFDDEFIGSLVTR